MPFFTPIGFFPPTQAKPSPLSQRLFSRRDTIPPRRNGLWRIQRGVVRTLTWSEEGTLVTLGYWGPGHVVGHPLSRLRPYHIECLTSVKAKILPSELWYQTVDAMVLHIQQTEELLTIVNHKSLSLRLWQFLVWLGEKFGRDVDLRAYVNREGMAFYTTQPTQAPTKSTKSLSLPLGATSKGRLIDLRLTHQEMAETINTSRVTVTRLLQQFESEGMLQRHLRRLILCGQ